MRAVPGVDMVEGFSGGLPLEGSTYRTNVKVRGNEQNFRSSEDQIDVYRITPGYPKVLGVPLVRGRLFAAEDNTLASAPVVLLNDAAAARYFPGVDPIAETIGIFQADRVVVGILGNVRAGGPEAVVRPEAYLPLARESSTFAYLVVKTKGDPAAVVPLVKSAVWSTAPDLPLSDVRTLEEFFGRQVAQRRFNMEVAGLFGLLALAIASVGVYGVMSYVVEQRTREIGLRMALGALPGGVVGMILRRAGVLIATGLAIGLIIAWALAQTLRAFLFQVQPHDVAIYAVASVVLLAAGLAAAFGPAWRAARVDPLTALRAE